MTNGEKIKEIFGIKDEQINEGVMFVSVYDFDCPKDNLCGAHDFFKNWWNAEYKEPFINKPCVSSGVCEHDKNKVLDKIDEIITDALDKSTDQKESQTLRWVLDKISEVVEDGND